MSALSHALAARGMGYYDRWIDQLPDNLVAGVHAHWPLWAEAGQMPPEGDWRTWMVMAGRGFGKTRSGAEWVRALAQQGGLETRIALVGASIDEVRKVMIEGESGLLSVSQAERPVWEPTRGRVIWPSGAQAEVYSASHPEGLRGPQFHFAWCDEVAKWPNAEACWANIQMGLRLGGNPRAMVTTTPRPTPLMRTLSKHDAVTVTRGRTADNVFLPRAFVDAVMEDFGGTRLGRQELDGELIDDVAGALWTRATIEACRARDVPEVRRVFIGVDPPAGTLSGTGGDACGIVVVGLGRDDIAYVIEDASVTGLSPAGWARAVAMAAARHGADRVIAEANNGGAMVESVLHAADASLPVKRVNAARGKSARAEPVALLYAKGRVKHVGAFPELEDELCGLVAGGGYEGPRRSPDRADALVWAVSALMLGTKFVVPRVRAV